MALKLSIFAKILESGDEYVLHSSMSGVIMRVFDPGKKAIIEKLSALDRKFGDVLYHAAFDRISSAPCSFAISLRRSQRVNFHWKGAATLS